MANYAVTKAGILLTTGDLTRIKLLRAGTSLNIFAPTGMVTKEHVPLPRPSHGYTTKRRKQFLPEVQTFFVDADESGNFKGEITVPEGVIPIVVPRYIMEKDPEKMTQKEFNMWREATSRRD